MNFTLKIEFQDRFLSALERLAGGQVVTTTPTKKGQQVKTQSKPKQQPVAKAEPPKQTSKPASKAEKSDDIPTLLDVQKLASSLIKAHKAKITAKIKSYGAKRLSDIEEGDRAEFMDFLNSL